jgi:hypothetical protein
MGDMISTRLLTSVTWRAQGLLARITNEPRQLKGCTELMTMKNDRLVKKRGWAETSSVSYNSSIDVLILASECQQRPLTYEIRSDSCRIKT